MPLLSWQLPSGIAIIEMQDKLVGIKRADLSEGQSRS